MQLEFKKQYSPAVSARLLLPGWVSLGEGHYQGRFVPWRELRLSVCLNCYIMIAAPNLVSGGQLNITYWDLGWPRKHNHRWKEEHYYVPKQNIFQQEYIHVGVGGTTWGMSILNWVPVSNAKKHALLSRNSQQGYTSSLNCILGQLWHWTGQMTPLSLPWEWQLIWEAKTKASGVCSHLGWDWVRSQMAQKTRSQKIAMTHRGLKQNKLILSPIQNKLIMECWGVQCRVHTQACCQADIYLDPTVTENSIHFQSD